MKSPITFDALAEKARVGLLNIRIDSRKVEAGDIFVAMPGTAVDGGTFIADALARGASFIVCKAASAPANAGSASVLEVEDPRATLGLLAAERYGTTGIEFPVVGVTGTNGKTTCTYLLEHLFRSAGIVTGVLGTVSFRWPGYENPAPMTTPDNVFLHEMLGQMDNAGVQVAFMEVSSHALDQKRVSGVRFAGALMTNLTQDHLDYHGDMESYFTAKSRIFLELPEKGKACVVNADDPYGRRLLPQLEQGLGFSVQGNTVEGCQVLQGKILECGPEGLYLAMNLEGMEWELRSPLVGAFNASNLLGVQAMGLALGLPVETLKGLEGFMGVPGRMERIENDKGLHVFVDYAHTPDALENVLKALRAAGFARVIAVFGCGGDRDRTKRPLMGQAVCRHADIAVLTSDNPRTENPVAIMADVKPGLSDCTEVVEEPDRKTALARALELARPGDAILVAGKGHEDYQVIGTEKIHFSDQETLRELMACA
ncbi:UDP-N-acetylmuramoyl-L-alanyl-D-glutamate--2,6-diaminopimelate ligase [Oleidesulfovibrio sp.]|uniref:UDP-N-acetylmuramoyl-L-alanyl-D-glutamate--2, 6-diaminopimelate ligase n=1 Tax=Oleidesulfovibrio sp. TaxID=2909707 RepID=UPI003A87323B